MASFHNHMLNSSVSHVSFFNSCQSPESVSYTSQRGREIELLHSTGLGGRTSLLPFITSFFHSFFVLILAFGSHPGVFTVFMGLLLNLCSGIILGHSQRIVDGARDNR